MQTVIDVVCTKGRSLREAVADDRRLKRYELAVLNEKRPGRNPGWAKIRSTDPGCHGTINLEWDSSTRTLKCRVVNRRGGKPGDVVSKFVHYLLDRFGRRIRLLLILGK
jgi:hypothetical protein